MTLATILIPAHNEAAVIGRTLWYLSRGLPLAHLKVIVIANACSDATAARARAAWPQAKVIETDRAGKCHALNLGYQIASRDAPIICLDADLDVTAEALGALLTPLLDHQALAACGRMEVDTTGVSPAVRAFYQGWRTNPYFAKGKFGGVFALSPEGAARVFPLPEIIADDEFIRRSFAAQDVMFVSGCQFVARAPKTLASLVRVRRRSRRGAREIMRMGMVSPECGSVGRMLRRALVSPTDAFPITVFLLVTLWVRLSLLLERDATVHTWERDLTTRTNG